MRRIVRSNEQVTPTPPFQTLRLGLLSLLSQLRRRVLTGGVESYLLDRPLVLPRSVCDLLRLRSPSSDGLVPLRTSSSADST